VADRVEVVVQVNGKLRARVMVAADQVGDAQVLEAAALADDKIKGVLAGKDVRRVVVVARKHLVNIVVG
jgi:leucyl-tRNA synthetase